jgi:hypothetical protein
MRFFRKKELIVKRKARKYNNSFLQPLAVGIVSASGGERTETYGYDITFRSASIYL